MGETVEIDLKELFGVLLKKVWVIVLCAIITASAVLVYTVGFVTPLYQASVTLYVNNGPNNNTTGAISSSNLSVALHLVTTYVNIIKSDTVLEKVIDEAGLELTPEAIRNALTAEAVDDTEMFSVHITNPDPEMAAQIANAVAAVAPAEIAAIIEGSSAKIIDYAKVPTERHSPSYTKNTVLGACAGILIAVAVIVVQTLLDVRIKNEEDLAKISSVPVLGLIPDLSGEVKSSGRDKQK